MYPDDLDQRIDYRRIYERHVKKCKISGDQLNGLCPFHNDKNASFGADLKTGRYKCLACGVSGNATTFVAELEGISTKEAWAQILKENGLEASPAPSRQRRKRYTIEDYASEKRLPVDELKALGIMTGKMGISIPYMDEQGEILCRRQRYDRSSKVRFSWSRGSHVALYGLWRLEEARQAGRIILVEGESDTQTLWHHGHPAAGAPGATTFRDDWADLLAGIDEVLIHQEPDQAGESFRRSVAQAMATKGFAGTVRWFSIPGHKDPSELHINAEDRFSEILEAAIAGGQTVDLSTLEGQTEELVPGAPVRLRCPRGWAIGEDGIQMFDKKAEGFDLVCRTPVLLTKRLKSLDTGEEKVEVAWLRDGDWHSAAVPRSTVFTSRAITQLADLGLTVTSENAKHLVRFLGDLEAENYDTLGLGRSVSQMGWYGNKFLPGAADDIVLDVDATSQKWTGAYSPKGSLTDWTGAMGPYRENPIFRFILAGSLAAPLLKPLNHRIFFIHNWGDSRSGKTAALKAALSVWGDPEALMASFNATRVGLERLAGFFNDLPLGIDEKQVVGGKQDYIETLVYMLSLGTSKVRGAKGGGLQSMQTWRTIVITTGEEPLTDLRSQAGVHTRALEVYGSPFGAEAGARRMHDLCAECYGQAGPEFVRRLISQTDADRLRARHRIIFEALSAEYEDRLGTHVSSVAAVVLADELAGKWIFGEDEAGAMDMGREILNLMAGTDDFDVAERATDWLRDWLASNEARFSPTGQPPRYGVQMGSEAFSGGIEESWCIYPSILEEALSAQGYNYRQVMRALMDKGIVECSYKANGKRLWTVVKKIDGKSMRMIEIPAGRLTPECGETPPF